MPVPPQEPPPWPHYTGLVNDTCDPQSFLCRAAVQQVTPSPGWDMQQPPQCYSSSMDTLNECPRWKSSGTNKPPLLPSIAPLSRQPRLSIGDCERQSTGRDGCCRLGPREEKRFLAPRRAGTAAVPHTRRRPEITRPREHGGCTVRGSAAPPLPSSAPHGRGSRAARACAAAPQV